MAFTNVDVQVSKETYEFGEGLAAFVGSVKQALADGWQPGQDIPVVITAALTSLVPAMQGMDKVGEEFQESKVAFVNALSLSLTKIAEHFVK